MQISIDQNAHDQRFDRFLRKYFKIYPDVKLSDIYSWIRTGLIKVNDKKSKEQYRVQEGDIISIDQKTNIGKKDVGALISSKDRKIKKLKIDEIKGRILHEDKDRLIFNKPAGIVIHPSEKHWNDLSMNDYLEQYIQLTTNNEKLTDNFYSQSTINLLESSVKSPEIFSSTFKPSFGYRLDKDTSGVLIAAKQYDALQYINKIIRDRKIDKLYLAIVIGKFPQYLEIDKPLQKSYDSKFDRAHVIINKKDGDNAKSECRNQKTIYHKDLGTLSLVKVKIHTGRMHQIRVHLADAGFPICGDIIYGSPVINRKLFKQININRQLLHCRKYSFFDEINNKTVSAQAPIPEDFKKLGFQQALAN